MVGLIANECCVWSGKRVIGVFAAETAATNQYRFASLRQRFNPKHIRDFPLYKLIRHFIEAIER